MATNKSPTATAKSPCIRVLDLDNFEVVQEGQEQLRDYLLANKKTHQQCVQGQRKCWNRKTSSKYKGVSWRKARRNWYVSVRMNYKNNHIGSYEVEKEAALAYDKAATIAFGEYARTNKMMFPEDFE